MPPSALLSPSSPHAAHPDPLLRRLRLRSSDGTPLLNTGTSRSELRDAIVIGFLFGSDVDTTRFGRDLYQSVIDLCRRNPHRFKCIYVSIDSKKESYKTSTSGKPWLSMVWNDGSSPVDDEQLPDDTQTAYDEDFIHNITEESIPINPSTSSNSIAGELEEERPYSRIAIAEKFAVLSVPHLAIYHIPTARIISSNVSPNEVSADQRDETMEAWLEGRQMKSGNSFPSIGEIAYRLRWTLGLALLAVFYRILRQVGGEAYDLANFVERTFFKPQSE